MNPIGKKFVSLFLVFSLMMLSVNLYAKERRRATLIIQRKSDQIKNTRLKGTPWEEITGVRGELIAVKQDSLLLLDAEGKDVSIDIADIKVITIVKKSKMLLGAGLGLLIGGGIGALIGVLGSKGEEELIAINAPTFGLLGGAVGLLIGGIAGAGAGKTIQIEGRTNSEIQETLDYLRKKARVRDYI